MFYLVARIFVKFLCPHRRTTMWKCLILIFVEDVNKLKQISLSFPKLDTSLSEFTTVKIVNIVTNWTSKARRSLKPVRLHFLGGVFVAVVVVVA